jgi:flagellar assembly factor FliW
MFVDTSRFGQVEVDDDRVITFPSGLLGFAKYTRYVLIQGGEETYFFWLQSVDTPELAFVVTDPALFVQGYEVPLKADQMQEMQLDSLADAQVFVIVNKRGNILTANLQGPLVVHTARKCGLQLVLADRRFNTRVPLLELDTAKAAKSA